MKNEQLKCSDCGKFIRQPFDQRTTFGCANPEAPEPYDPDYFCRKCATKMYKKLLVGYKCCHRDGDWQKSNAEMKAAKEAGLEWVDSSGIVEPFSGREIMYRYIRTADKNWIKYLPYLEYHEKRRKENRCICWRIKNKDGNCPICNRSEVMCLCKYSSF